MTAAVTAVVDVPIVAAAGSNETLLTGTGPSVSGAR